MIVSFNLRTSRTNANQSLLVRLKINVMVKVIKMATLMQLYKAVCVKISKVILLTSVIQLVKTNLLRLISVVTKETLF